MRTGQKSQENFPGLPWRAAHTEMASLAVSILLFLFSCASQSTPGESSLSVTFRARLGEPPLRITAYYSVTDGGYHLRGIEFCDKKWFLAHHCRMETESGLAGMQVTQITDSNVLPDSEKSISFEDLNFDGYLDLKFLWSEGPWSQTYACWLYVPEQRTFKYHEGLSDLPSIKTDPQNMQVLSWMGTGSTAYSSKYRWQNGKLEMTEENEGPVEWEEVPE